jgi:hypothetical protein
MQSLPKNDVFLHCQKCNKDFSPDTLIKHMAEMHTCDKPALNCVTCENTFTSAAKLIEHLTQKHYTHSLPLKCGYNNCYSRFGDLSAGTRHFKNHDASPRKKPKRKKHRLDESQAMSLDENRSQVSNSKVLSPHLQSAQSIWSNEVALEQYLRLIRDDPIALVELLKFDNLGTQLNIDTFVAALESGRCKPLERTVNDADIPQVFDLKDVEPELNLDDVSVAAIKDLGSGQIYQGHNNKSQIPYKNVYLLDFMGWKCKGDPKYATNIPLPQFLLRPPEKVAAKYHSYQPSTASAYAVSANVSMRGTVVDIHEGTCRI